MRIIFHVDVNNAFLSWTALDLLQKGYKKDIRNIPSVIAGDEKARKGIVLAKSIIAKKYGIVTAEPLYSARKKCPSLQIFPPNYSFYHEQSKKLYAYLAQYTPNIEQYSIDECFLDLSGTTLLYGHNYVNLAHKIKDDIKNLYGFTVNIGIGENKLCAKMASDFEKPNRVHTLYASEIETKMWPLPVQDLFMLGKSSAKKLHELGINTIKDLAFTDISLLKRHFKNQAYYFKNAAMGLDDSKVEPKNPKNKCLSISRTLPYDYIKKEDLEKILFILTDELARELRNQKLYTKTIAITYRNYLFKNYSHQLTLLSATNVTEEIYKQILNLFNNSWHEDPIRNIGIRFSDLKKSVDKQLSLFDDEVKTSDKVEEVMDDLIRKFGKNSVIRASKKE